MVSVFFISFSVILSSKNAYFRKMNKIEIHQYLMLLLLQKKEDLVALIKDVRSSNNETKSAMGDKYETSRERIQQEINRLLKQGKWVEKQIQRLDITPVHSSEMIEKGSVFQTNLGTFYLSVSFGKFNFENQNIFAISEESPLAKAVVGLKKGDEFQMNAQKQTIKNIW